MSLWVRSHERERIDVYGDPFSRLQDACPSGLLQHGSEHRGVFGEQQYLPAGSAADAGDWTWFGRLELDVGAEELLEVRGELARGDFAG